MNKRIGLATTIPAALLIFVLVLTLGFACTTLTAHADADKTPTAATPVTDGVLSFGQMSDIHYFPVEYCYPEDKADYADSDFYHSTTGDTKLVTESGAILKAHIEEFINDAKAGRAPHYLFATGDLSKNGERAALIDVANALRHLQNEVRKENGYENFQVFVIQGNHDLYNGSGSLYRETDGSGYVAETVTSGQFALIFAGLGYPDIDYSTLRTVYPEEYWSSSYTEEYAPDTAGYVVSSTASTVNIEYYSAHLTAMAQSGFVASDFAAMFDGANINSLSYHVTMTNDTGYGFFVLDGTDREKTEDFVPVRVGEKEYSLISADADLTFHVGNADGSISETAASEEQIAAALAEGNLYVNSGYDHITGGRLTEELLVWMRKSIEPDRTYVAAYHFNVLPHFEQEDDILKDFVFYNWEYIAKEFLEMGVRYGISGHMHASDVTYYTDAAGRTFYDIETGSSVSYASPRRYMTITPYELADGKTGEQFASSLHVLTSFEGMTGADDYNDYINGKIYGTLVERIVEHFVTMRTIEDLDIVGLLPTEGFLASLKLGPLLETIIDDIAYELYPDGYPDGQAHGDLMEYLKESAAAEVINLKFGAPGQELTLANIFSFIMTAHASGLEPTTEEVFGSEQDDITGEASALVDPHDPVWRARYIAALKDFAAKCDSGQLARDLFGILLDALYYDEDSILKTLFEHEFDLTIVPLEPLVAGLLEGLLNGNINDLLDIFGDMLDEETKDSILASVPEGATLDMTPANFSLGKLIDFYWPVLKVVVTELLGINLTGNGLYEAVDGLLGSYLTDSFYVGLSGIAKNIVIAYATDDDIDLADRKDPTAPLVLRPHEGYASEYSVALTYVSDMPVATEFNLPTTENGRLPSHLTTNFLPGDEDGESYALSFYTAEEIGAVVTLKDAEGNVLDTVKIDEAYMNSEGDADHREVTLTGANGKITLSGGTYAQYIPLIDLGLLTISHTETGYEEETVIDGEDVTVWHDYTYNDRDNAPGNSVVYRNRWTVTFDGLEAGAEYIYSVGGVYGEEVFDLALYAGCEEFSFTTMPGDGEQDFDFVAIADMQGMIQSMYEESAAAIEALMGTGGYDFVLNAGDMADNGDNFNQWGWAFNENLEFFANSSVISTAGNHEDTGGKLSDFHNYDALVSAAGQNTDSGLYFSFDYATAHVIVLNTNDADAANGLSTAQYDWLINDLQQNRDAKWTFVLMHKSLYSGGSHSFDGDVKAMREQLVPVFYEYGVDLVLAGHDHTYTVTECLDGSGNAVERASVSEDGSVTLSSGGSGVMYVTLGTIGTKFYDYISNSGIEGKFDERVSLLSTLAEQTFARISVRGDTLTFTGYTVNSDGSVSAIVDTDAFGGGDAPEDDMLLVKILVPIAAVVLVAGVVITVVLVRKKKAAANGGGNAPEA